MRLVQLAAAQRPLREVVDVSAGGVPATVYRPTGPPGAVVVIVHGLAGSRQVMAPFAVTLARAGYTAVAIDLPGHGRNSNPLPQVLTDSPERTARLGQALNAAVGYARGLGDGRVGLLGHSMGGQAVVRYAEEHPEIAAVVAVSAGHPGATSTRPRNLLMIVGAFETGLRPLAQQVADRAAGGAGQPGVTYGDVAEGSARRVIIAPGVEHVGVLFSPTSTAEALAWCQRTMPLADPPAGPPYLDARLPWLALLYAGAVLLLWPVTRLFPRLPELLGRPRPIPPHLWWAFALAPAPLSALFIAALPGTDLLPVRFAGPLALLFATYGLATGAALGVFRLRGRAPTGATPDRAMSDGATPPGGSPRAVGRAFIPGWRPLLAVVLATLPAVGFVVLVFGLPTQLYLLNYFPPPVRLPVFAVVATAMLPYFLADECLVRRPGAPPGAYAVTKILLLGSIGVAILVRPGELLFLVVVMPLLCAYLAVYGLFSTLLYRRTATIGVGAVTNALLFAWIVTVTFPLVR